MQPTEYDLLPFGRPLNPLFADNVRFRLVIEPKCEQHDDHVQRHRRVMAWMALRQRLESGLWVEHARVKLPRIIGWDLAKTPKSSGMTDDESGIGIVGDTVNQVEKDAPPFKPTIVDDEGNEIEGDPDAEDQA